MTISPYKYESFSILWFSLVGYVSSHFDDFSSLNKILDDSWYTNPENHIVTLYTPSGAVNYQVFSIYTIRHTDFANTIEFKNAQEYQAYLKGAINSSIYNFNQQLATSDKILTLYTCANNNQYRSILHAKQIR